MTIHGNLKMIVKLMALSALLILFSGCNSSEHDHGNDHLENTEAVHEPSAKQGKGEHEKHSHGEHASRFGPGMAITAADEHRGIQLSEAAHDAIGITKKPLSRFRQGGTAYRVPASAIVEYRDRHAVFLSVDGWYRLLEVHSMGHGRSTVTIELHHPVKNARLVTGGTALLRLAHVAAFDTSSGAHVH